MNVVTASSDKVEFRTAVKEGDLIELVGRITSVGRTSMKIGLEMYSENLLTGERELCTTAQFTMVALDEDGKPTPVPRRKSGQQGN